MLTRPATVILTVLLTSCATDVVDERGSHDPGATPDPEPTSCTTTKTLLLPDDTQVQVGGQCLPEAPRTFSNGQGAACVVIDGRKANGACICDAERGRAAIEARFASAEAEARASDSAKQLGWDCFCEIVQLGGAEGEACRNGENGPKPPGFCYVDPTTTPPTGNPALAAACPDDERHLLRFSGLAAAPVAMNDGAEAYRITCDVPCD